MTMKRIIQFQVVTEKGVGTGELQTMFALDEDGILFEAQLTPSNLSKPFQPTWSALKVDGPQST